MEELNRTDIYEYSKELSQLTVMIQVFSNSPKEPLGEQIKIQLEKMNEIAHVIGGNLKEGTHDLIIDVNLYLANPNDLQLSPKIFQDTQALKNELRKI